jgi:hypothetical protein
MHGKASKLAGRAMQSKARQCKDFENFFSRAVPRRLRQAAAAQPARRE